MVTKLHEMGSMGWELMDDYDLFYGFSIRSSWRAATGKTNMLLHSSNEGGLPFRTYSMIWKG